MAEVEDIELAVDDGPRRSPLKLVLFLLVGLVLAGGGTAGVLIATGIVPMGAAAAVDPDAAGEDAPEVLKEARYVPLDPPFTVNFSDKSGARYLQIAIEAMTREEDVEPIIKRHMPVIRNDLMLLFSSKSSQELNTRDGKEALRVEALATVQRILERETGKKGIEAVYFTSFVMQ